jgi:hypothetical protein
LMPSYLDNLCRLGILEIPREVHLSSEKIYEPLENDEHIELYRKAIAKTEHEMSFKRKVIQLTTFGEQFVNNVVKEKK